MTTPPHLPPKSCSVPLYKRLRLIESIIFVSVLAFISGLVGGIISDVYITPEYDEYTGLIREQRVVPSIAQQTPDPLFVREQFRRTISLLPKNTYEQSGHIAPDSAVTGILLTDTGWFVAPIPAAGIQARSWVAVTASGLVYDIESLVFDTEQGLVYGSIEAEGFRVVSFPVVESLDPGVGVWVAQHGTLERTQLAYPSTNKKTGNTYSLGEAAYTFSTVNPVLAGSVVWTEEGNFLGFVEDEGVITPWYVVKSVYTNVFTGNAIAHPLFPIHGYIVTLTEDESALAGGRYGFYVERVDTSATDVIPGDIIVEFRGDPIVPWLLEAQVAEHTEDKARLTVLAEQLRVEKYATKK